MGLLAILVSGLLLFGAAGGIAVGEEKLGKYAKAHSRAMANDGYIYHSTGDQLRRALDGYDWELGGENVGVGGSLESLEDAFMASELHRQNILRRVYDHAAVGIVRADDQIWITVIFYG